MFEMSKRRKKKEILSALNLFKRECEEIPAIDCCENCYYKDICNGLKLHISKMKIPQNWDFDELKDSTK